MPFTKREPKFFGRRYPWRYWFGQGKFTLRRGVDYNGRSDTMAQQVRNTAMKKQYRKKVSIMIADDGESVTVKVLGDYKPGE